MANVIKLEHIPSLPKRKRVGVYCRVSSTRKEQLESLAQQVSYFTKYVQRRWDWILADFYIDFRSAETAKTRAEYMRMLDDCRAKNLDLVITKSISRFGRDTLEMLKVIRELRELEIGVIFEEEMLSTLDDDGELMLSLIGTLAQADNESRSKDTRWGLVVRAKNGTSKLYNRRCYGYFVDKNGDLQINDIEATVVRSIFEMYLSGESVLGIIRKLEKNGIKTPTGRDKWSDNTIIKMLSNEKYCGDVEIFKSYAVFDQDGETRTKRRRPNVGELERYVINDNHPAIISKGDFAAVQAEKARRSNVERDSTGTKRKSTRYSSKKRQTDSENN